MMMIIIIFAARCASLLVLYSEQNAQTETRTNTHHGMTHQPVTHSLTALSAQRSSPSTDALKTRRSPVRLLCRPSVPGPRTSPHSSTWCHSQALAQCANRVQPGTLCHTTRRLPWSLCSCTCPVLSVLSFLHRSSPKTPPKNIFQTSTPGIISMNSSRPKKTKAC